MKQRAWDAPSSHRWRRIKQWCQHSTLCKNVWSMTVLIVLAPITVPYLIFDNLFLFV